MSEASYPYTAKNGVCHYNAGDTTGVMVNSYTILAIGDLAGMQTAIMSRPLSVSIDASQSSFNYYQAGIYADTGCANDWASTDHATNLVGWGTDAATGTDYWIMRNSWGTSWGEAGYMKVKIVPGNGICGIQTDGEWPVTN